MAGERATSGRKSWPVPGTMAFLDKQAEFDASVSSVARLAARNMPVLSGRTAFLTLGLPLLPPPLRNPRRPGNSTLETVAAFPAPPATSVIVCTMIRQKRRLSRLFRRAGLGIELPFTKRKDRTNTSAAARVRARTRKRAHGTRCVCIERAQGEIGAGWQRIFRFSGFRRNSQIYFSLLFNQVFLLFIFSSRNILSIFM